MLTWKKPSGIKLMTIQRENVEIAICVVSFTAYMSLKTLKNIMSGANICEVGVGCKIYESRPKQCKDFQCGWSLGLVPEEWKPNKVGFVVTVEKEESYVHKVLLFFRYSQS